MALPSGAGGGQGHGHGDGNNSSNGNGSGNTSSAINPGQSGTAPGAATTSFNVKGSTENTLPATTPLPSSSSNNSSSGRRLSFRRSLADASASASLPPDFLESLEAKRKQLDESIHKYIAAKEREYKVFEKELRHRVKEEAASAANSGGAASSSGAATSETSSASAGKRRVSFDSPASSVIASGAAGLGEDGEGQLASQCTTAKSEKRGNAEGKREDEDGVKDERNRTGEGPGEDSRPAKSTAKTDADPDSNGQQTPPASTDRSSSAPDALETLARGAAESLAAELKRTNSDTTMQAKLKPKRPAHMQLAHRTSSSGSSADGRAANANSALTSAMKSPSQQRKPKRVSLQVGGEIVIPSQPVPQALSHYSSSSHSRTRSPSLERPAPALASTPGSGFVGREAGTLLKNEEKPPATPPLLSPSQEEGQDVRLSSLGDEHDMQHAVLSSVNHRGFSGGTGFAVGDAISPRVSSGISKGMASSSSNSKSKIDADGDLFDLEAENLAPHPDHVNDHDDDDVLEDEFDEDRGANHHGDGYDDEYDGDDPTFAADHNFDETNAMHPLDGIDTGTPATRTTSNASSSSASIAGRVNLSPSPPKKTHLPSTPTTSSSIPTSTPTASSTYNPITNTSPYGPLYDPSSGLILPSPTSNEADNPVIEIDTSASTSASQQPTHAGFRRPSVVRDPVFNGPQYAALERNAVERDIYGSSFNRKGMFSGSIDGGGGGSVGGSFGGSFGKTGAGVGSLSKGSLGESFMERNSEELMRLRGVGEKGRRGGGGGGGGGNPG